MVHARSGTVLRLVAFEDELARSLEYARRVDRAMASEAADGDGGPGGFEEAIRSDHLRGALLCAGEEEPKGLALWDPPGPLGLSIRGLYLDASRAGPTEYRDLLSTIERERGPIAIVSVGLPGLPEASASEVFRGLGYAPFSRSEMVYPVERSPPEPSVPEDGATRSFRPGDAADVARVHGRAYTDQFDRYLFLRDLDPQVDAVTLVRDLTQGRWGEFLPFASTVASFGGRVVASTLVVRTPAEALIADVATDPEYTGRGFGRAVVSATVRSLRQKGEPRIRLAVTDQNLRAVRLYERLGFVRRPPPSRQWYHPQRIPVGPAEG